MPILLLLNELIDENGDKIYQFSYDNKKFNIKLLNKFLQDIKMDEIIVELKIKN